jgi:hypothetical protein
VRPSWAATPTYKHTKIYKKCAKEKEQFFINLFVKYGAIEENITYCEQRATLKPGSAREILAKKAVQEQIKARMEVTRLEQMRQTTITEAAVKAKAAYQRSVDPEAGSQR